jgi:hypothetical protein
MILDILSPWSTRPPKEAARLRPKKSDVDSASVRGHERAHSQSSLAAPRAASPPSTTLTRTKSTTLVRTKSTTLRPKAREDSEPSAAPAPSPTALARRRLAPIAGSPSASPAVPRRTKRDAGAGKENFGTASKIQGKENNGKENAPAKAFAAHKPVPLGLSPPPKVPPKDRRGGALADVTSRAKNAGTARRADTSVQAKTKMGAVAKKIETAAADTSAGSVRDRMREWERERERLRALELESAPASRATSPVLPEPEAEARTQPGTESWMDAAEADGTANDGAAPEMGKEMNAGGRTHVARDEGAMHMPLLDRELRLPRLRDALYTRPDVPPTPMSPGVCFPLLYTPDI